jgi:hypothetical protein
MGEEQPNMAARVPVSVLAKRGRPPGQRSAGPGFGFDFDGKMLEQHALDSWS